MELDDFIIPSYMSFNWHTTIMKSFSFFLSIYLSILPSIRLSMTYRFLFNELSFVFTGIYLNAQVVPDLTSGDLKVVCVSFRHGSITRGTFLYFLAHQAVPDSLVSSLFQPRNQKFLQGALVPFSVNGVYKGRSE